LLFHTTHIDDAILTFRLVSNHTLNYCYNVHTISKKPIYNIIFDTNVLFGYPFSKQLEKNIAKLKQTSGAEIRLFIPDVVETELKANIRRDFDSKIEEFNRSLSYLNRLLSVDADTVVINDENKNILISKLFTNQSIEILPTEYAKINLQELVRKATSCEAPFQQKDEKGFKDSIIAGCITHNIDRLLSCGKVIIICNDGRLRGHVESLYKNRSNVEIYESLPDFLSNLDLQLIEFDNKAAESLIGKADLYFKATFDLPELKAKIFKLFGNLIQNPQIDTIKYLPCVGQLVGGESYKKLGSGSFEVSKPVFMKKYGDKYVWDTTMVYRVLIEHTPPTLEFSNMVAYPGPSDYEYVLDFGVQWEAKLASTGVFEQGCINAYEHLNTRSYITPVAPRYPERIPDLGNTTASGQGTSPISPDNDTEILRQYGIE